MRHGGVYVGNQAIPGIVCVGCVARERRNCVPLLGAARKSFLNEDDVWMVVINIGLRCSEFTVVAEAEGIP